MVNVSTIASPWINGYKGTLDLLFTRNKIGQEVVSKARLKIEELYNKSEKYDYLEPLITEFLNLDSSSIIRSWCPELINLFKIAAGVNQSFEDCNYLQFQIYVIRATSSDFEGVLYDKGSAGYGAINGIAVELLKGLKIQRQDGQLQVNDSNIIFSAPNNFLCLVNYKGTAEDLIHEVEKDEEAVSNAYGVMDDSTLNAIEDASSLLVKAEIPLSWISSSISTMYVTAANPKSSRTGSWDRNPGFSYFSNTINPYQIAEAILHEACHQNFYFGNMDDSLREDDGTLRFSPAVKSQRPIWALLLAYHAFSNVAVFFKRLSEKEGGELNNLARKNIEYSKVLENTLNSCKFNLPNAAMLFEVLQQQFNESLFSQYQQI